MQAHPTTAQLEPWHPLDQSNSAMELMKLFNSRSGAEIDSWSIAGAISIGSGSESVATRAWHFSILEAGDHALPLRSRY